MKDFTTQQVLGKDDHLNLLHEAFNTMPRQNLELSNSASMEYVFVSEAVNFISDLFSQNLNTVFFRILFFVESAREKFVYRQNLLERYGCFENIPEYESMVQQRIGHEYGVAWAFLHSYADKLGVVLGQKNAPWSEDIPCGAIDSELHSDYLNLIFKPVSDLVQRL